MAEKQPVTGRLSADTKKRFEEYREKSDISQSDAVRRLIGRGLDSLEQEENDIEVDPQTNVEEWVWSKMREAVGAFFLGSGASVIALAFFFFIYLTKPVGDQINQVAMQALAIVWGLFFVAGVVYATGAVVLGFLYLIGQAQLAINFLQWARGTKT